MQQLRIREIRPFGQVSRFPNVDLGAGGVQVRGDSIASIYRTLPDGKTESLTFLPDTLHNRACLCQRRDIEIAEEIGGGFAILDSAQILADVFRPASGATETVVLELEPAVVTPDDAVLAVLADFLALSKDEQLAALETAPEPALRAIVASQDPRVTEELRALVVEALDKPAKKTGKKGK